MGAGQSGGHEIDGSSMGYQVLRVYPNSPGSQAGLKAYFDFIVAIGNTRFNKEDGSLREILKASVDQKLKMIVYNTRNKQPREVEIIPTTSWGGSGLLGVSIKHSSFDKADERVWHVVEVDPGSPAHQAGLKPGEDYVIGSDSILQESDDLYNLIEAHEGKALKLFVYNSMSDNCREVICHPNSRWGGRGFLGCEFGHGLLHRIPYADDKKTSGDTATTFQSNLLPPIQQQQQQFQQPQQQLSQPQQTSNYGRPQTIAQQQQQLVQNSQLPLQPGHHLFQQALFSHNSGPSPLQQQQPARQTNSLNQSTNSLPPPSHMLIGAKAQQESGPSPPFLPQPPQAPQTFAQLASAQTKQDQQYHYQQQQQQQPDQYQQQQQQQSSNLQYQPPPQQPPPQQLPQQQSPYQHNSTASAINGPNTGASGLMPSQFPLANTWAAAPPMAPSSQPPPAPTQSGQSVPQPIAVNSFQLGPTDSVSAPPRPPMIAHTFAQLAEAQSHQPNSTPDQTQLPEQTFHQQQFFQQQQSQPPHYQP